MIHELMQDPDELSEDGKYAAELLIQVLKKTYRSTLQGESADSMQQQAMSRVTVPSQSKGGKNKGFVSA